MPKLKAPLRLLQKQQAARRGGVEHNVESHVMTLQTVPDWVLPVNDESDPAPACKRRDCPQASVPEIRLYDGVGMSLHAPRAVGNPKGKGGGRRGRVLGWTTASRRRMRHFLLTHRVGAGLDVFGVTLTVPGGPDVEKSKEAFHYFQVEVGRRGWCAVWRVEVQKRGALHWHLLMGLPAAAVEDVRSAWYAALRWMGWAAVESGSRAERVILARLNRGDLEEGPDVEQGEDGVWVANRMLFPGAVRHSFDVQQGGGRGSWLRYLQDHATKAKQDQIAVGIGRHWGVIGRERFEQVLPDEVVQLEPVEYFRVVRWCQRLATPRVRDDRCPFGRRAGYPVKRGRWGASVWFTRVETVQRMIEYAASSRVF